MRLRDKMIAFSAAKLLAFGLLFAIGYAQARTAVFPMLEQHLHDRAAALASSLSRQLDVALGADDRALAEGLADAALADRDFGSIEIVDAHGRVMYTHGDVTDGVAAHAEVSLEGIRLGAITVVLDRARIDHLRAWMHGLAALVLLVWLVVAVYSVAFARATVVPIRAMMEFSKAVAHGDLSRHLEVSSTDELDELGDYLNAMTRELAAREAERRATAEREAAMQHDLVNASRVAGMAEVATGVIHNVGNVLNNLNTSANVVADRLRDSRADGVAKVVALYAGYPGGLPAFLATDKGKLVPDYLAKVAAAQADDTARLRAEIANVLDHVAHIKTIVATQQSYALVSGGVRERVELAGVIDDALRLAEPSFERHRIEVVRDYPTASVPAVVTDRHKLLQIIVNLVTNARDAMSAAHHGGAERAMTLTARIEATTTGHVAIAIADTGVGIQPEVRDRIFQHGFTTKRGGHGFGLHASANAARELGGDLDVTSDGADRGATFTVMLPPEPMETRHGRSA